MAARIDEGVQLAITVARDEDGLTAHIGCEVVVLVGDLALVREIDPVALEDVLHLEFKDFRVGKDVASDPVDALHRVVLHRRVECSLCRVEHRFLPIWRLPRELRASLKHRSRHRRSFEFAGAAH